jgi:hypothetical protein
MSASPERASNSSSVTLARVIEVVRFLRDLRPARARVTRVDALLDPRITATQID